MLNNLIERMSPYNKNGEKFKANIDSIRKRKSVPPRTEKKTSTRREARNARKSDAFKAGQVLGGLPKLTNEKQEQKH